MSLGYHKKHDTQLLNYQIFNGMSNESPSNEKIIWIETNIGGLPLMQ
jgi:hypothetical protein